MQERIGFLPLEDFKLNETISKDYLINCNWALYCDNYLEGFHIPFVHPDLNDAWIMVAMKRCCMIIVIYK